jgi:hypothetical protein
MAKVKSYSTRNAKPKGTKDKMPVVKDEATPGMKKLQKMMGNKTKVTKKM